uniref:glutamine synthetase-like n=1 Tax=Centroberyx gerrardi TaxID=166262 RepID=UPI003AAB55F8
MSVLSESPRLNKAARQHYLSLAKGAVCLVTYIWIDITGDLQCKTKTLDTEPTGVKDIPEWDACWLRDERVIEVLLVPVRMFRDPFNLDPNKLVLCEVLDSNRMPMETNQRSQCAKVMEEVREFHPWFGLEQEYRLFGLDGQRFGWPPQESSATEGYCSEPTNRMYGRDICTCHCNACLYAGVKISGTNPERKPSQWEFQVGPCEGIEIGDHLWVARYILQRVCEDFGVVASLAPKPIAAAHDTSGCHANFSTEEMRSEGGLQHIEEAIRRLSKRHSQHLRVYDPHGGKDNISRLTSQRCTSSFYDFSAATAQRNVSVRIPGHVSRKGRGYLEDRRPAANCDPYAVIRALAETCLLGITGED